MDRLEGLGFGGGKPIGGTGPEDVHCLNCSSIPLQKKLSSRPHAVLRACQSSVQQFNIACSSSTGNDHSYRCFHPFHRLAGGRASGRAGGRAGGFGSNHGVIQRPSASCDALQGLSETSKVRNSTQILRDSCLTKSHQMRAPLCGEEQEKKT